MKLWSKLTQKSRDNFQVGQNISVIQRTVELDAYLPSPGKSTIDYDLSKTADKLKLISNKLIKG